MLDRPRNAQATGYLEMRQLRAETLVNVWASVMVHREAGGESYPALEECLSDEPDRISVVSQMCDRAECLYDATPGKYEMTKVHDKRTMLAFMIVEEALATVGRPPLLVGLLLHLYPFCGRFVGRRVGSYRTFRPASWVSACWGGLSGIWWERRVDDFLRAVERTFLTVLQQRSAHDVEPGSRRSRRSGPNKQLPRAELPPSKEPARGLFC